ncbi:MAG: SGNH/GDSL hydrolase family protein [Streptomycetaceae bacterium]|nr:MAG: SGNH/GDSL hydrolase family protein [Streptomycetaceae bacterium]
MHKTITFAIMGDSAASGVGDTDSLGVNRGWSFYLANAFNEPLTYVNVARPGAKSAEVRYIQLEKVLSISPDITAVIVGGNDVLRNGFDPTAIYHHLRETTSLLKEANSEVLLLQLHDPTQIVPLPKLLARVLRRRINALNAITHSIAAEFGAIMLDTRCIENVYHGSNWHVDKMHPSKIGHQMLAAHYRELLIARHWKLAPVLVESPRPISRTRSIVWMVKHGTPWFLKRSVDLLPAAMYLSVCEGLRILRRRNHDEGFEMEILRQYFPPKGELLAS